MGRLDITDINHVGMAVRDLAHISARYEAMGFQLTPYSPHSAAWKPGDTVKPLGSGNRCVMFGANYLEILASEDPGRPAQRITTFLDRHQGAHIICFDTDDCGAVDGRLKACGVDTSGVIPLQREIDTPDGVRTARFERVQFAPKNTPEGYIQAARHLTPEYIYQPRYTSHANGCFELAETVLVALDMDATVNRYAVYTGLVPKPAAQTVRFELPQAATLTIVRAADAVAYLPGSLLPPLPGIAAVGFRTTDLDAVGERLRAGGFAVSRAAERLLVPAEEAGGVALLFGR